MANDSAQISSVTRTASIVMVDDTYLVAQRLGQKFARRPMVHKLQSPFPATGP
jgi:hypothetical protein